MENETVNQEPVRRRIRKVGRKPSPLAVLVARLLRIAPTPYRHRARVRERLDLVQGLRRLDGVQEEAP